jgi:FAD/FMN-containing dehydrogenase
LPAGFSHTALIELLGMDQSRAVADMERMLESALAAGLIGNAAIAKNERERAMFWAVRENAGEGFRTLGPLCTYDVSMPISTMGRFGERVEAEIAARYPGATTLVLGHLGDGNLHVVAAVGDGAAATHRDVDHIVYGIIRDLKGSVSAEHGIGTEKRDYLAWSRTSAEIALMRALKATLDPAGILNPGKVL